MKIQRDNKPNLFNVNKYFRNHMDKNNPVDVAKRKKIKENLILSNVYLVKIQKRIDKGQKKGANYLLKRWCEVFNPKLFEKVIFMSKLVVPKRDLFHE